jgi:hypothetical protein
MQREVKGLKVLHSFENQSNTLRLVKKVEIHRLAGIETMGITGPLSHFLVFRDSKTNNKNGKEQTHETDISAQD